MGEPAMTTARTLPALAAALNRQSYEYLQTELPDIADALAVEVGHGATPSELRRFTERHTGRGALAARVEQAAAHLVSQRQAEAA